jgi:hypothetical protein
MERWISKFTETIKKLQGQHKYHVQFIVTKCSFKKTNHVTARTNAGNISTSEVQSHNFRFHFDLN